MKWQEFFQTKGRQIFVAALFLLVVFCICIVRGCNSNGSSLNGSYVDRDYIATVTYVITLPDQNEEPITYVLKAASNGKAIIPDIEDTDDTIWSGWFTEDGETFDFNTVLTKDLTIYGAYYYDENNNDIVDGSPEDPITVYQFLNVNGAPMLTKRFLGLDAEFDYSTPEYAFPQSEDDGYIFLGWIESRSVSEDGGAVTVMLTPNLASDRNNNNLIDGSVEDPYIYHVFLAQDGTVLEEIKWLTGEAEVKTDDIACPTTTKQKLVGWDRTESQNDAGNTVYTYTPIIEE